MDRPGKGKNLNVPKVDGQSVKTHVHDMDGPNKGQKLKQTHEVKTPRRVKTIVPKVDGHHQGLKLKSTT